VFHVEREKLSTSGAGCSTWNSTGSGRRSSDFPERSFCWNSRAARPAVVDLGVQDQLDRPNLAITDHPRGPESERLDGGRRPPTFDVRQALGSPRGRRLGHDESTACDQEPDRALRDDWRRAESPGQDDREPRPQPPFPSQVLGAAAHNREAILEPEGDDRALEELASASAGVQQHAGDRRQLHGYDETRHATTAAEVKEAINGSDEPDEADRVGDLALDGPRTEEAEIPSPPQHLLEGVLVHDDSVQQMDDLMAGCREPPDRRRQ